MSHSCHPLDRKPFFAQERLNSFCPFLRSLKAAFRSRCRARWRWRTTDAGGRNGTGVMLLDNCWRSHVSMAELLTRTMSHGFRPVPEQEASLHIPHSNAFFSGMGWAESIVLKKRLCLQNGALSSGHLRLVFQMDFPSSLPGCLVRDEKLGCLEHFVQKPVLPSGLCSEK